MQEHALPPLASPNELLTASASRSARLLCRAYGAQAARAADDIEAAGQRGIDARHHFRVALRRLRVTLLAYRSLLQDCNPEKLARRAAALARRIGVTRNRDVQQVLMQSVRAARTAPQRAALAQFSPFGSEDATDTVAVAAFRRRWRRFEARLHTALETWHDAQKLSGQQHSLPFSSEAATALDLKTAELQQRCAAITGLEDITAIHSARLVIKAIRYLIAPLADDDARTVNLRTALRAAQDLMGIINDAWSLREHLRTTHDAARTLDGRAARVTGAGLAASDRDLTERMMRAYAALGDWRSGPSLAETIAVLRSLAESWRRGTAPPMEYERKWLLSALPPRLRSLSPARLQQGYLPGEVLVERVRQVTEGRATRWFRTVKLGRGIARIEVEEETTAALGKALFALTEGRRVSKRRYAVTEGALVWEIDEFTDRELCLAEVELPDATTTVELPGWLAQWVVREVTDESSFTNWKLAR